MKKTAFVLALLTAMILAVSCTGKTETHTVSEVVETKDGISYRVCSDGGIIRENGSTCEYTVKYPAFEGASGNVTGFVENETALFVRELEKELEDGGSGRRLTASLDISVTSLDDGTVSLHILSEKDSGGTHTEEREYGATFGKNGERLMPADIFSDEKEMLRSIRDEIASSSRSEMLFDDYEEKLSGLTRSDDSFYIENGRIVFICPPYLIAPYSEGSFYPSLKVGK